MKKILKYIFRVLFILFLLLIITAVVFKARNEVLIGSTDKENVEYLNKNKFELDRYRYFDDASFNFFDDDFYKSKVFFLGETHGYAELQAMDKSLLFHLNKKIGTQYYVVEMDSIRAKYLNDFLNDEQKNMGIISDEIIPYLKKRIMQQAGKETVQKWSDIYDYNRSLPDSLRIEVLGVDKVLGDTVKMSRDSAMMKNFAQIVQDRGLEEESFYAFFGLFHTLQAEVENSKSDSFAARLKSAGYNVQSIICFNVESEVYLPKDAGFPVPEDEKTTLFGMDGPLALVKGINDLKKAGGKNTMTIFNLDGEGSPYRHSQSLISVKTNFLNQNISPADKSQVTTDYAQYAILLRNAHAITPVK
jgi:hypothetical protein